MKDKQIVFTEPNVAQLLDLEIDECKDDEVLVKIEFTAISCGTERANLVGDPSVSVYTDKLEVEFPRKCGYSGAGVVAKVGKDITKFKVGDRVSGIWGFHRNYIAFKEEGLVKVPDSVSLEEAAFSHIATFPMAAVRKTKVEMGESAIVMGLGILGAFAVSFLKASGATPVIAVDPTESRREMALKLGADYALDPKEEGFVEKVKELTGGGVNVAIEVTGLGIGLQQVLDCMAKMGRVALLGCTRNSDFTIDYYRKVHGPGITLIGAHTLARPDVESYPGHFTHFDDKNAFFNLLKYNRISIKELISEVHKPEEAFDVFTRLANDRDFPIGVLFDWR